MTRKIRFTLFAIFVLAACQSPAQPGWDGTYIYEADLGETGGGISAVVEYTLTLAKDKCQLTIQGYQADESIVCSQAPQNDRVAIRFRSYADGKVTNAYGTQVYKADETLFSLSRSGGQKLLTQWGALKPSDDAPASGEFFKSR